MYQLELEGRAVDGVACAIRRMPWPGIWQTEPDAVNWVTPAGWPCAIRRGGMGTWCGYVFTPPGHPWGRERPDPEVHGGITLWERDVDGAAVTGFDCGHFGDFQPAYCEVMTGVELTMFASWPYRDAEYAMGWAEMLAVQAATVGAAPLTSPFGMIQPLEIPW